MLTFISNNITNNNSCDEYFKTERGQKMIDVRKKKTYIAASNSTSNSNSDRSSSTSNSADTDEFHDRRLCQSYYDSLCGYNIALPQPAVKSQSSEDYLIHVRKCMLQAFPDSANNVDQLISNVKKIAHTQLTHPIYYEWFKNDPKACHWLWYQLRILPQPNNTNGQLSALPRLGEGYSQLSNTPLTPGFLQTGSSQTLYESLNLPLYPASHSSRLDIMIYFLYRWQVNITEKEDYINQLQRNWNTLTQKKDLFAFITPTSDEACEWVWGYLKKCNMVPEQLLPLKQADELYYAIYTAYYNWCGKFLRSESEIKLFELQFGNTKGQYRHREKTKEKKAINIRISEESKNKLEEIMHSRGISQAHTIEWAITHAYTLFLQEK